MSRLSFLSSRRVKASFLAAALITTGFVLAPEPASGAAAVKTIIDNHDTTVSQNAPTILRVQALDGSDELDAAFNGTVGFVAYEYDNDLDDFEATTCDPACFTISPNNGGVNTNQYSFIGADDGEKDFTFTWLRPGTFELHQTSTIEADAADIVEIDVIDQGATQVVFDGEDDLEVDTTPFVGVADAVQVSLLNALDAVDKTYALQVTFTNSTCGSDFRVDPHIGDNPLGKNYVFQPGDQGRRTFNITWLDDDPSNCTLNVTANVPTSEDQPFDQVTGIDPGIAPATTTTTGVGPTTTTTAPPAPPAHEPVVVTGALAGGAPHVLVKKQADNAVVRSFYAYDQGFQGGVNVAFGDVNDDGWKDIVTAAGPGGGPHVKVFSGKDGTLLRSFFAYSEGLLNGVNVGVGDVNGDGKADVITGPNAQAGWGPHVKVFTGAGSPALGTAPALLQSFFAYAANFTGGVRVAAADMDNDGKADIITGAGVGGGPHVKSFKSNGNGGEPGVYTELGAAGINKYAFEESFTGGVYVAASKGGDNKVRAIVGSGPGRTTEVRALQTPEGDSFPNVVIGGTQGVSVAVGQLDSDESDEYAAPNASGSSTVRKFNFPSAAIGSPAEAYGGFPNGVTIAIGVI